MILPSKHLPPERALLFVGARILQRVDRPKTVSQLWTELSKKSPAGDRPPHFDWFVLALDLLYVTGAIEIQKGVVLRTRADR